MDNLHDVITQMNNFGIPLTERDLGRIQSFTPGKKMTLGKGGKCYAKFFEWMPSPAVRLMTGYFGSYKTGEYQNVDLSGRQLSAAEINALREQRAAQEAAARALKERDAAVAALKAEDRWQRSDRTGVSPYAEKKLVAEVGAPWVRFERGTLLIPLCRYDLDRRLVGLQLITPEGAKFHGKDVPKQGSASVIGHHADGAPIFIGEGWATMATIWLALDRKYQCVVAFDRTNLLSAAQMMRTVRPDAPIVFCADDDSGTPGNPGRHDANAACKALRPAAVGVVVPNFSAPVNKHGKRLTDFNDLHVTEGLDVVAKQLRGALGVMREFGVI